MNTYLWYLVQGYEGEDAAYVMVKAANLRGAQQRAVAELKKRTDHTAKVLREYIENGEKPDLELVGEDTATAISWSA
jgi:hypothetical protein